MFSAIRRLTLFVFITASVAACVPAEEEEAVLVITDPTGGERVTDPDGDRQITDRPPIDGAGCVDTDGDGWAVDCLDFGGSKADCDDTDPNNWLSCATCVDEDGDGAMGLCDAYDGIEGPDCSDADPNNWLACATCSDGDGDGYFAGCDAYETLQYDCDDGAASVHSGAEELIGNGADDDCDPGTPDQCAYTPTPATDTEPGHLAGITRLHNLWRWRVGVPALSWNAALARDATDYAEECVWEHDPNRSPGGGYEYVGENLYATTVAPGSASVLESVQAWADERYDFDFGFTTGQTTGGQVGHYTQMVWRETTEVGCGWAWCGGGIGGLDWNGGTMVVCRYGPGGNYTGEAPYDYQSGVCLDLDNDDVWQAADPDDTNRAL